MLRAKFLPDLVKLIKQCLNEGRNQYLQSYAGYIVITFLLLYIELHCQKYREQKVQYALLSAGIARALVKYSSL